MNFLGDRYCSAMQVIPNEIQNIYTTDIWINTINYYIVRGNFYIIICKYAFYFSTSLTLEVRRDQPL